MIYVLMNPHSFGETSQNFSALDYPDDHDNYGNDKKNMDKTAQGIGSN